MKLRLFSTREDSVPGLNDFDSSYAALRRSHLSGGMTATDLAGTYQYYFGLRYANPVQHELNFRVVDAAGEIAFPLGPPHMVGEEVIAGFENELLKSQGFVFALAVDSLDDAYLAHSIHSLCAGLERNSERLNPLRIAVALTKCDDAFASDSKINSSLPRPEAMRQYLKNAIRGAKWIERFHSLDAIEGGVHQVRFVATSSAFRFLTADPFIFATTGLANRYFFRADDILAKPTAVWDQSKWDSAHARDEPPAVPKKGPAAIQPLWDGNVLTIPKGPVSTDQGEVGFSLALRGLRKVLHTFADEISNEANIDRRFISFVRSLAGQIAETIPPQHKLFEIGHVEAVFAEYTRTVNDQWPNFLVARYHAIVLQFDRTMRQSEAWREFKRNAQEAKFTDAQTREAAELVNSAAAALRNDEAGDFVDPLVPQVLEQLADPRSRWPDDALAEIEAGKEELAADLIESINNIFKAVADAALPVVTEIAASARRTMGKTAAAFWEEFEKGAVAEAKARGKPAGRAAVRWLLRFAAVTGGTAGAAGAAYGAYAGFSKLMTQYPEAFGWLQQLLRFFQQALPPL